MGVSFHQKFEIAQMVRARGATSRLEISQSTGVALPTISTLVRDLIRRGIVAEEGYGESAGGRRPAHLRINPDFAASVGIELSTRRIVAMLVDVGGNVRGREAVDMPAAYDRDVVVNLLFGVLNRILAGAGPLPLRGVGIGISGIVDASGRVSRELPLATAWQNVPLADLVERRFGYPTSLLNLVHAATLGEIRFGGWQNVQDMVYLHIGRGIAVGLIVANALCRGATGNSGEFGHNVVREDAPVCYCGNRGCLEVLASPKAIIDHCRESLAKGVRSSLADKAPDDLALDDVLKAAQTGDKLAFNAVDEAGRYIGGALANLVNVLNPDVLMLGGILADGAPVLVDSIQRAFRSRVLPLLRDTTRIESSRLRENACAMGAAAVVFDRMFQSPESLLGESTRRAKQRTRQGVK